MTADLRGQVALVTGGGRGLGRAFALALARCGAAVAVLARSQVEVAGTAREVRALGAKAIAIPAGVTDPPAVFATVEETERELGPVDLLVANAGTSGPIGPLSRG